MTQATQQFIRHTMPAVRNAFELRPVNLQAPRIFERPFADMAEVRGRINCSDKEIMTEIESLRLRWAFNFAASNEKIFLRVYKPAIEHWVNPKVPVPEKFDELMRKLFSSDDLRPGIVGTVTGTLFQETFNLSHQNMANLLTARLILARDDKWGNGVSPLILLPSVIGFLKGRQLS